jgi:hypothetical protein
MPDDKRDIDQPMEGMGGAFHDAAPDPRLEDRVVAELSKRGLLAPAARPRRPWSVAIAAAVVLAFGAGWLTARETMISSPASLAQTGRWVMLLYRIPGEKPEAERLAEYQSWAAQAKDSGVVVSGEKLDNGAWALSWDRSSWSDSADVAGYFVVQAADADKAMRIARSCPHVKYGGKVELRRIIPT